MRRPFTHLFLCLNVIVWGCLELLLHLQTLQGRPTESPGHGPRALMPWSHGPTRETAHPYSLRAEKNKSHIKTILLEYTNLGWNMLNDTVMKNNRASLGLQWLRIRASTAGDTSLIPDWGSSPCFLAWPKSKTKQKRENKKPTTKDVFWKVSFLMVPYERCRLILENCNNLGH